MDEKMLSAPDRSRNDRAVVMRSYLSRYVQAVMLADEGQKLMLAGKPVAAEPLLIESLQYAQTDGAYRSLHLTLCKLGRFDDALYNAFAWAEFSNSYEMRLCLAELYRKKKRYKDAIDELAQIPLRKRRRKAWQCLAYCHLQSSDWDAALLCFEAAEADVTFSDKGTHGSKQLRTYAGYVFMYDQYLNAFPPAYRDAAFVATLLGHARRATDWFLSEEAKHVGDLQQRDYGSALGVIDRHPELTE